MVERVLIQGERDSFHDQAAQRLGVPEYLRESANTHGDLFQKLRARQNGRAIVAFVNTTKGRIKEPYEQILAGNGDLQVTGRVDLNIVLPLLGLPGSRLDQIEWIHTQDHAWQESRKTARRRIPKARWVKEDDTAGSAEVIRTLDDPTHAAIAPLAAAAGLTCLIKSMQDQEHNVTSFYMLERGHYGELPANSTLTVAALQRIDHEEAEAYLRKEVDQGNISPVHELDIQAQSLIVEMNSGGDHFGAIAEVQTALDGLYRVTYLGGYPPLSVAG